MNEIYKKLLIEVKGWELEPMSDNEKTLIKTISKCDKNRLKMARIIDSFVLYEFTNEYVPAFKRTYFFNEISKLIIKNAKPKPKEISIEWLSRINNVDFEILVNNSAKCIQDAYFKRNVMDVETLYYDIVKNPNLLIKDYLS